MEYLQHLVQFFLHLVDIFLHLDKHLAEMVAATGPWIYVILFLVIFAETGLVIIPFLPGDSLLFAVGAIAALPEANLNVWLVGFLMFIAAVLGDAVNYAIGRHLGPKVFYSDTNKLFDRQHLERTQSFYAKHGGKTIILARFMPIIRTFAPFVAGVGNMGYPKFALYNVVGALLWVIPFTALGFWFGNLPIVKQSFHYVILAIIVLSVVPIAVEFYKSRKKVKVHEADVTPL